MSKSKIVWTDKTINVITGCRKISPGCDNCYAEKMHKRLQAMGLEKYDHPFNVVRFHPEVLQLLKRTKKPIKFFINSMSDIFHHDVSIETLRKIFEVVNIDFNSSYPTGNVYQVLTKRPDRLIEIRNRMFISDAVWMGVTVENNDYLKRIEILNKYCPVKIKFVSFEPLLSEINFPSENYLKSNEICWVIVGGETGPSARPMEEKWVLGIKEQCEKENIPFFFKSWGGRNKKKNGNLLQGKEYKQFPLANIKSYYAIGR